MGWLDASEYFLMEIVVRDRAGDIGSVLTLTTSDDGAESATPDRSNWDGAWRPCTVDTRS